MAELADALDLGSSGRKVVEVQVLSPALTSSTFSGLRAVVEPVAIDAGDLCEEDRGWSNTEQLHVVVATAKGAGVNIVPVQ